MQQHIDEFSVNDLRHTLAEAFRVIADRRLWFVLPFCAVTTLAFMGSHVVPRRYAATTVFERTNDPILAGLLGQRWTQACDEQRQRIEADLTDKAMVLDVLRELDLPPEPVLAGADGATAPPPAAREALAREIVDGITCKLTRSSQNRDQVRLTLTLRDSALASRILPRLREHYCANARQKTVNVLNNAGEFFENESARSTTRVSDLDRQLCDLEEHYPGINPDGADPIDTERARLEAERTGQRRQIDELTLQREQAARKLDRLRNNDDTVMDMEPALTVVNPRYAELHREIDQIQAEIDNDRTVRFMTDKHPAVAALNAKLRARTAELAATAPRVPATEQNQRSAEAQRVTEMDRLAALISETDAKIAGRDAQVAAVERQILALNSKRDQALDRRDAFQQLKRRSEEAKAEWLAWQQQLGPVRHMLAVENSNRGIQFSTLQEVSEINRPSEPSARIVLGLCVLAGIAVGGLCVLLAELLDRSFRTTAHLGAALGVPLIESIDEIVTAAVRRRRWVRRMVVAPATAFVLTFALLASGAMAWLSLESPNEYERLKSAPVQAVRALLGRDDSSVHG